MPELQFHPPVQCPALLRIICGDWLCRPAAFNFNSFVGQLQAFLDRQRHAPGNCFRKADSIAVDTLIPPLQRSVIRICNTLDDNILFVPEIFYCLGYLLQKLVRHTQHAFIVMKRLDQVFNPGTMGMAISVAQLADSFSAADLDAVCFIWDDNFLQHLFFADFVIPDLYFHSSVELPSFLGGIIRYRLAVAKPLVRDCLGRKIQGLLAVFCYGSGPFPGQSDVVSVYL